MGTEFVMSNRTLGILKPLFDRLSKEDQKHLLIGLAHLSAEIEVYLRNKFMEEQRAIWSEVLRTTLLIEPRNRRAK